MMTAGRRGRERVVAIALVIFIVFAHVLAWYFVARYVNVSTEPDKPALVVITGTVLLSWSLLMSQAMESVTRAFYARSDLDLILSSPTAARKIFAVRIGAMALSVILMAALLGAPIINVPIARGGARWLGAYGVVIAMGATAAACAVALTVALFRTIGPKRTRLAAQIVAAVIAAVFIIGLQVAAILSHGSLSRMVFLESDTLVALVPEADSLLWLPARAALGDLTALAVVLGGSLVLLGGTILVFSARFGDHAIAASSVKATGARQASRSAFRRRSPARVLRQKEWTLLLRDPWLVSQTLMQLLYLLPPALLLWRSYGEGTGALVVLVPVLVMAAGQLAGGLAWLAISGEDAPDLVATAPVLAQQHHARQGRGRPRRHRDRVRAVHCGAGLACRSITRSLRRSASSRRRRPPPASSSGSANRRRGAISVTARPRRALRPSRKHSRRSPGRRPRRLRAGARWGRSFRPRSALAILIAARWMSPHRVIEEKKAGLARPRATASTGGFRDQVGG